MSNNIELVNKLMQEIGLDIDNNNYIIDQDNGNQIKFNGKNLKYNSDQNNNRRNSNEILFNPIENPKLMNNLFSYYTDKINQEDGRYVNIYYPLDSGDNSGKGKIELKEDTNDTLQSNNYYNDCLKYADLIFQLGGDTNVDLTEYDSDEKIVRKNIK